MSLSENGTGTCPSCKQHVYKPKIESQRAESDRRKWTIINFLCPNIKCKAILGVCEDRADVAREIARQLKEEQ